MTALITQVHELVEVPNWAPWLRFSLDALQEYNRVFPAGQFVDIAEDGFPAGALTTTRITWSGDPAELSTWDAVAGQDSTIADAFDPHGNTLVLLSMSIRSEGQGRGLSANLVSRAVALARHLELEHVISPFRPSGYGAYKLQGGDHGFTAYCRTCRSNGEPTDPWLRALDRMGMRPLKEAPGAMTVPVDVVEWSEYEATYRPGAWVRLDDARARRACADERVPAGPGDEVWECGETGSWFVDRAAGTALYSETNLWGEVPMGTREDDA